jgi:hypothetical protein
MAAKAKVIDATHMIALAKDIKAKHALINRESDELEVLKTALTSLAVEDFYKEAKSNSVDGKPTKVIEGVPAIYGNFEIPVDNNDKVTVNFQVGAKSFTTIDDKPAASILKGMFGPQSYEKVFDEKKEHKVIAPEDQLDEQSGKKPELFGYGIRPDADTNALRNLYLSHPELFTRQVINLEKYAEAFPEGVETTTKVCIGSGFIEKVGKLDANILENAKRFLVGLFGATLKVAIKCGNANKK